MANIVDMALSPFAECFTLLNQMSKLVQDKRLDRKQIQATIEMCTNKLKTISDSQEEKIKYLDEQLQIAKASQTSYTIQFSPGADGSATAAAVAALTGQFAAAADPTTTGGEVAHYQPGQTYIVDGVPMEVEDGGEIGPDTTELIDEKRLMHQGIPQNELIVEEEHVDSEAVFADLKARFGDAKFYALMEGAKTGNLKAFVENGLLTSYESTSGGSSAPSLKVLYGCLISPKCKGLIFRHNLTCLRHVLVEHWGGFKPQKCDYCEHRTFLKQQMNIHLPIHTGEGRHKCPVEGCNYTTSNHKMWKVHRAKHEGVTFYQCDMCDKGYYKKEDLAAHRNRHLGVNPYVCKLCRKSFAGKANLNIHMKYHLKPYKCSVEECDYRAGQPHKLRQHIETFHAPGGAKARASVKSNKTNEVLDRCVIRGRQTREDGTVYYQCTFSNCPDAFESEEEFRAHLSAHFDIPEDYVCRYCDKVFRSVEQRNMHVKYGHIAERNTGFKLLPTPTKVAASAAYLSSPQKKEAGRVEGNFQCTFPGCNYIAAEKKKLEAHQLQRHKVRPYSAEGY